MNKLWCECVNSCQFIKFSLFLFSGFCFYSRHFHTLWLYAFSLYVTSYVSSFAFLSTVLPSFDCFLLQITHNFHCDFYAACRSFGSQYAKIHVRFCPIGHPLSRNGTNKALTLANITYLLCVCSCVFFSHSLCYFSFDSGKTYIFMFAFTFGELFAFWFHSEIH